MHYLHQGTELCQGSCQALLVFTVCEDAVSLFQMWHGGGNIRPSCGNPGPALPQPKPACLNGFSGHLFFRYFVATANLISPCFACGIKTASAERQKARSYQESKITSRGMTSCGIFCKDNIMQKRNVCWSTAWALGSSSCWELPHCRTAEWSTFFLRPDDTMPPHLMRQLQWESLRPLTLGHWTMTAINPTAKPAGRGTKCETVFSWKCAQTTTWWR